MKKMIIFLFLCTQAYASLNYLIYKDQKGMPKCLETTLNNKKINLFLFTDYLKSPELRRVYLAKFEQEMDEFYSKSLCVYWENLSNQFLRKNAIEIDFDKELPNEISSFTLTPQIKLSLMEMKNGFERFIPANAEKDDNFLKSTFEPFKIENHKMLISDVGNEEATTLYHGYIKNRKIGNKCAKYIGTCEYYLCREKNKTCGAEGYFLGFGYQYCSDSLKRLSNTVTVKGQAWLQATATCLHKQMEELDYSNSCSDIKKAAIESHDKCYSKISFCSLSLSDITQILEMIHPALFESGVIFEGIQVLGHCAGL